MRWHEFNLLFNSDIKSTSSTWYHRKIILKISKVLTYIALIYKLKPNLLTTVSTCMAILGVLVIIIYQKSFYVFIVNFICLQLSFALDSADGQLARIQKDETVFGKFLDIYLDRVNNFIIFIGFGLAWVKFDPNISYINIISYICTASIFILYTIIAMTRGFIYKDLEGTMQNYGKSLKQKIFKLPYQLMNMGTHSLLLSMAYLFGVIYQVVIFYGVLSLFMIITTITILKLKG